MGRTRVATAGAVALVVLASVGACGGHRSAATAGGPATPVTATGAASPSGASPSPRPSPAASPSPASSGASPGPSPTPSPATSPAAAPPTGTLDHVAVILMENHDYGQVIGSPDAPYVNSLAHAYALATSYFAVSHPSLPNYLALVGGSTFGVSDDCTGCHVSSAPSLANQLATAGISWTDYQEGMPSPCFTGPDYAPGRYAKKHNPFVYFDSLVSNATLCSHVVPASSLPGDVAGGRLPAFTWITPNLCDDTHDCPVATGDRYLAGLVPGLLQALGPHGALFIVWDEDDAGSTAGCCGGTAAGGHVAAVVAGSGAAKGATSSVAYDHYSVLRTIEDNWHLPELGNASCACTRAMTDLLAP